jgi:hypothetical protein
MQEEVASWTEGKVREKVKDWKLKELLKNQQKESRSPKQGNETATPRNNSISEEKVEDIKQDIKQQIESCSAEKIREILIKLIDKHPEIVKTIKEYLEED